jgi:hypothetical protein
MRSDKEIIELSRTSIASRPPLRELLSKDEWERLHVLESRDLQRALEQVKVQSDTGMTGEAVDRLKAALEASRAAARKREAYERSPRGRLEKRWAEICKESKRRSEIYGHGKGFTPAEEVEHQRVLDQLTG